MQHKGETAMRKLKRVVVKEELVALTGDLESALILNQFIYWSERVKDFDKFIMEEAEIREKECLEKPNIQLSNGWIYKDMEELKGELMLSCSIATISRKLSKIVDSGWLDRRNNPEHKWDKRYQYRVNLNKIALDLYELGYALQDYKVDLKPLISSNSQNANSDLQNANSNFQNDNSDFHHEKAISKITTEITTEINNNKLLSNSKGITDKKSDQEIVVVENFKNQKPKNETEAALAKEEIMNAYQEIGAASDDISVFEILGEDPSAADLERMKNAISYVKSEYVRKDRKIKNLPGLIRRAFEKNYEIQTVDPIAQKHEKRLAKEREKREREMVRPPANPEIAQNGLQLLKSVLMG